MVHRTPTRTAVKIDKIKALAVIFLISVFQPTDNYRYSSIAKYLEEELCSGLSLIHISHTRRRRLIHKYITELYIVW